MSQLSDFFNDLKKLPDSGPQVEILAKHLSSASRDDGIVWWGQLGSIMRSQYYLDMQVRGLYTPYDPSIMSLAFADLSYYQNTAIRECVVYELQFKDLATYDKAKFSRNEIRWPGGTANPIVSSSDVNMSDDDMQKKLDDLAATPELQRKFSRIFKPAFTRMGLPMYLKSVP